MSPADAVNRARLFGHLASTFGVVVPAEVVQAWVWSTADIPQGDFERAVSSVMQDTRRPASIPGAVRDAWRNQKRRASEDGSLSAAAAAAQSASLKSAWARGEATLDREFWNPPRIWDPIDKYTDAPSGPVARVSDHLRGLLEYNYGPDWFDAMKPPPAWETEMVARLGADWRRAWQRPSWVPPFAERPRKSPKRAQEDER